jgi:hypothetical protein
VPVHQVYQGRCPWPEYLQHHPPWRPYSFQCQPAAHVNRLAKNKFHLLQGTLCTEWGFIALAAMYQQTWVFITILSVYSTIQLQIQFALQILLSHC